MQRNEVVFQIEVCEVVAVKELSGQLLQAAARQVDRVHPLGRDLTKREERDGHDNAMSDSSLYESIRMKLKVPLRPSCASGGVLCRSRS